jgi:integrase
MSVHKVHRAGRGGKKATAWKAQVRLHSGQQVARVFDRKVDADAWETDIKAKDNKGEEVIRPVRSTPTFAEFARQFLADKVTEGATPGTIERYKYIVEGHLIPAIGDVRVGKLTESQCRNAILGATCVGTDRPLARSTATLAHAVLRSILGSAKKAGYVRGENPASGWTPPAPDRHDARALERSEFAALVAASPEHLADLWTAVTGLGLRQGEALAVGAGRNVIDYKAGLYRVRQAVHYVDGEPPWIGRLKSEKPAGMTSSRRDLPMSGVVMAALRRREAARPAGAAALWTTSSGDLWRRSTFNDVAWKPCLKRAGLDPALTMHSLRHTYASMLIDSGLSPKTVQERMGHASITETMDTYGHLFNHDAGRTAAAVDAWLPKQDEGRGFLSSAAATHRPRNVA